MTQTPRKLVAIGATHSAATGLLEAFLEGSCLAELNLTIPHLSGQIVRVNFEGRQVDLSLWDNKTDSKYASSERLPHHDAQIIVITFEIDSSEPLENIKEKCIEEAASIRSNIPIFLVGCNKELRHSRHVMEKFQKMSRLPVTVEQGEEIARSISAWRYMECSPRTGEGVQRVLEACALASLVHSRRRTHKSACIIM
ncbi:P-loop containing nucleoside triphosphate hydrolase protein [Aspergillus unguis]